MKHQVLYIKKNLIHSAITTSKDIKIRQPGPELRGVSKKPRTFGHPVVAALHYGILPHFLQRTSGTDAPLSIRLSRLPNRDASTLISRYAALYICCKKFPVAVGLHVNAVVTSLIP